jgi:imidazole glycerol phosphate synthase glutamine amidotransferase subunit
VTDVLVVKTGTANTASVLAGLRRVGATPRLTDEPGEVRDATHVVLPGVGAFAAAMEELRDKQLVAPLRERLAAGRPTLAICLGMQLLGTGSEESPGVEGLGVVDAVARRFPAGLAVPQLGWNNMEAAPGCRTLEDGSVYFANSYRLQAVPDGCVGALAVHGAPFVAAFERERLLACQFHPELSGAFGRRLLQRWLEGPTPS